MKGPVLTLFYPVAQKDFAYGLHRIGPCFLSKFNPEILVSYTFNSVSVKCIEEQKFPIEVG